MSQKLLLKSISTGLALSCCVLSQPAMSMDAAMSMGDRTSLSETATPLSQIPLADIINNAYAGNEPCRQFVIEKLYNHGIQPNLLGIDIPKLLQLDQREFRLENFSPMEVFLLCEDNPNNIFFSEEGTTFIGDLNIAEKTTDLCLLNTFGCSYGSGIGNIIPKDQTKAIEFWEKIAEQGYEMTQSKLWKMAAEQGDLWAQYSLNQVRNIELLEKYAEQGYAMAQYKLATYYFDGILYILNQNQAKAIKLWKVAAKQGYAMAQYKLATYYSTGIPDILDQNQAKAIELWKKAAKQGNASALYILGMQYYYGILGILDQDIAKAIKLWKVAAKQGDVSAQYDLGTYYSTGIPDILDQNQAKAIELWKMAAKQGDVSAQYDLGRKYCHGIPGILDQDIAKAISLLKMAAEQGYQNAAAELKNVLFINMSEESSAS